MQSEIGSSGLLFKVGLHLFFSLKQWLFLSKNGNGVSGDTAKYTSLPGAGALKLGNVVSCSDASSYCGPMIVSKSVGTLLFQRRINRALEARTLEQSGGEGELAPGPSCESSSLDMPKLPWCVIAGHFRGPGEPVRARRGIVALNTHAMEGANAKGSRVLPRARLQAVRAGRNVITFCGGSRASVTVDLRPVYLSKLVRTRRGDIALNVFARGGASAKKEHHTSLEKSAAKAMFADRASRNAVIFCGGSRASVTVNLCPVDLSEHVRMQRGIIALNVNAVSVNVKREYRASWEQSAAKGTFSGRTSGDVTFCDGSHASVAVNLRPVDLSKLVRMRRVIVALNAYAVGSTAAKREKSATRSTPASYASNVAVAFRGGAGKLKLEPCVPSNIVRQNNDVGVRNAVASARVSTCTSQQKPLQRCLHR